MLKDRQISAIPIIVASATYKEGYEKAGIAQSTFYEWLKQPEFVAEIDRQRKKVAAEAFGILTQNLTKSVEKLVGMLDCSDDRLKRLVCKDIIEHVLGYQQVKDIESRLTAIEQRLGL